MRPTNFRAAFFLLVFPCLLVVQAHAQLFETKAKQAYLVEADTGTVLFAKNENERVPPASLAKLMTMEVVFNAIKSGRLTLDDEYQVSENAWRTGGAVSGGSTMFAEIHSNIALRDLIQGVIIQSANDGCIVIAEGMAGSIRAGVSALPEAADAALILLADMPEVTAEAIDLMIAAYAPEAGVLVVGAAHEGKRGNPVLWDKSHFEALARLEGDSGARHLLDQHPDDLALVETGPGARLDLDTPEALAAAGAVPPPHTPARD